jgi:Uma2 family endonuclease
MVVSDKASLVTAAEFEQFMSQPEHTERRFELIQGKIVEKMPTQLHALITSIIVAWLFNYSQKNPIAWVFTELRIKLPDDDVNDRIPDIAVVLKEGREFQGDAPLSYMPDLIVEIQSPGQSDKFMADKALYYLEHGARMVWIVYPTKRLVETLTQNDRQLLTGTDTLDAGDVLPGFALPLKDLFAQP